MTREELIERIKGHVAQCSRHPATSFGVDEVVELADGILAVRETDGEHTLYYDQSKCRLRKDSPFEDEGPEIPDFPTDTGFITNVMARSWPAMLETARMSLRRTSGRGKIEWHKEPVKIEY